MKKWLSGTDIIRIICDEKEVSFTSEGKENNIQQVNWWENFMETSNLERNSFPRRSLQNICFLQLSPTALSIPELVLGYNSAWTV
jgi:hypothetical protein